MCSFNEKLKSFLSLIINDIKKTFKSITKIIKIVIPSIIFGLVFVTKIFVNCLKWLKSKVHLFSIIKIICFLILVLSGLSVTLDYLSYPYIYKLIVSDNKYGFDLPAISVCTERHVFFDKHKVIQYFDLELIYDEWKQNVSEEFEIQKKFCKSLINDVHPGSLYDRNFYNCFYLETEFNYNLSQFFRNYERKIIESLSFDQMKNLTISANELFKCSAKLHFRYNPIESNLTKIPDCFERFDVLESIYGNNFGICYTFFAKNYSIYFKDDDYIQFDIKYETQKNFIINGHYNKSENPESISFLKDTPPLKPDSDDYFGLYFSVNPKHREMFANFETSFKSTRNSLNSELRFRKTSVELLSTPYMQECKQYGESQHHVHFSLFVFISGNDSSYQDCYQSCIEELLINEKCVPNPFITDDFVLLNSSQTKLSFCNSSQNYKKIDKTICDKKCIKDCSQTYYTMSLNNKYYLTKSDSIIQIKFKSSQDFRYECEVKIDFVTYLSNIGGLISLWFGLSFIDLSSLIKLCIVFMKIKLSRLNLQKSIEILGKYYIKFKINSLFEALNKIVVFIEKHDLKTFLTLLSVPIFLYQIYELVDSYLQFSTEVSVEIISFKGSDNNISYHYLPAITVCNDHIFEELFFNPKIRPDLWNTFSKARWQIAPGQYVDYVPGSNDTLISILSKYHKSAKSYHFLHMFKALKQIFDVNNEEEYKQNTHLLNNKRLNGFNFTVSELNFYEEIICVVQDDSPLKPANLIHPRYCKEYKDVLKIISPFGKCLTYLYRLNELNSFLILNQYFLYFAENIRNNFYEYKFEDINRRFIIHSQNMFPTLTDNDLSLTNTLISSQRDFLIKATKYEFERLPKPYDTNCQMYGNSNRFQCLNECYFDGYMNSDIKCIPNSESLYTFVIEGDVENQRKIFCESDDENLIKYLNKNIKEKCNKKCVDSCDDTYFSTDYQEIHSLSKMPKFKFILKESYYRRIIYSIKMTFFILLIQIANIWSLWHGITFQQLFELFIKFFKIEKFVDFLSIIGQKIIVGLKLEKIIMYFIAIEKKVKNKINLEVSIYYYISNWIKIIHTCITW